VGIPIGGDLHRGCNALIPSIMSPSDDRPNLLKFCLLRRWCPPISVLGADVRSDKRRRDELCADIRLHEGLLSSWGARDGVGVIFPRGRSGSCTHGRLRSLRNELLKRVGEIAAGWNAGAGKVGAKLPAWVTRHGPYRSAIAVVNSFRRFRITMINAVKYVTNVADYDRRIQSAITIQANKKRRQAEFLLTRALKRGGWK
jgi:hypothetical protein